MNEKNVQRGTVRSSIRELFEYGKKRKAEIGDDNVFDFSLGNPSIRPPKEALDALKDLEDTMEPVALHGYTSAQGNAGVRQKIADYTNERFGTHLNADCLYMTCGAAASVSICLNALMNPGDEMLVFAPYFPEYKVFAENAELVFKPVSSTPDAFRPDMEALKSSLTDKTWALLLNSPNNPSGVTYNEEEIEEISKILEAHEKKTGHPVYIISDEPYRELVYEGTKVPYIMNYYKDSLVCYSYSKSLSLPGERIGYIAVNPDMEDSARAYAAVCGAGRALGYVCAPSLFQNLIERVYDKTADISEYKRNRDLLYDSLTTIGYSPIKPEGAFYMFVKSLEPDAKAFAERAKHYELLLVPGDDFGVQGYVRISYCVDEDMIRRAVPAFKALYESYGE